MKRMLGYHELSGAAVCKMCEGKSSGFDENVKNHHQTSASKNPGCLTPFAVLK